MTRKKKMSKDEALIQIHISREAVQFYRQMHKDSYNGFYCTKPASVVNEYIRLCEYHQDRINKLKQKYFFAEDV